MIFEIINNSEYFRIFIAEKYNWTERPVIKRRYKD